MTPLRLDDALRAAVQRIAAVDARVLLCYVTGRNSASLAAHPEAVLSAEEHANWQAVVARRAAGEPVAYITGEREFYGRSFRVTPAVLIPRPETELLVDLALERLRPHPAARVLDLGTGSGCIGLAIVSECSHVELVASDQSLAALNLARDNCAALRLTARFVHSDWFRGLRTERFAVAVSNPPYVAASDPHLDRGDLRFEPRQALEGGADGLDCIRVIVSGAVDHLEPGGWLLLEHGHDQARHVRALFSAAGYDEIFSARDLAGIERVTGGRLTLSGLDR